MDTDSELEDIDLESTEVSDQDADKEYDVEKILAWKLVDGEDRYLVLWKGYPIERSTWEPARSFTDPNTILEWSKTSARQKKGLEPEFDWREWDRQRVEDAEKGLKRRQKREIKRRRLGWVRPESYNSGSELEGFVVADDEISSEEESDSPSESETDILGRVGKRKKGSASIESEDLSDDSLIGEAKRKLLRKNKRLKSRRRSGNVSQEDSRPGSPKAKAAEKREDRVRVEKRKRVGSPSEILSGAAKNLSLESAKQGKKKHNDVDRQVKKQKLQGPIKMVVKPLKPGPSRLKQRRASGNLVAPGQVRTFTSLSHVNRINKAGKNEPPPDPSQLELFAPGQPGRVLPPMIPLSRRTSTSQNNLASQDLAGHSIERAPSPVKVNKSIPYANFKIPKRRPTILAPGAPKPSHVWTHDDGTQRYLDSETAHRRDSDTARDRSRGHRGPALHQDAMDIDSGIGMMPLTTSPGHLMEVDNLRPSDPRIFICKLEQGPHASLVGEAKLIGFPPAFVEELYNKPDCRALWISKFYGQNYLKEYFAPHYGIPLHVAVIEIDPDQVQPLINALAFLKGAGVVLHANFTMLVFLPSNHDLDKQAFKLPQLPATGPNKIKPALRVVVYPPLEGVPIPSRDSNSEMHSGEIIRGVEDLPWWEKKLQFSLPAYLACTIDCNWDEVLDMEKENIERAKGKEAKETNFVLIYPLIAEAESKEFKQALECLDRKVIDLKQFRDVSSQGRALERFTFLIHQSLRRQLHLLPYLLRERTKDARNYWFYGTKIDSQVIEERPQKIWSTGSIILLTPQLIASGTEACKEFINYAGRKAATTKLALPSVWEEKVMESMLRVPNEEVLNHVFDIKEKIKHKAIILIPVNLHLDCNELDVYIDEFALYQLENPFEFRRYVFGHPTLPDPGTLEIFQTIEFYTPELFKAQVDSENKRTQRDQDLRKAQPRPPSSSIAPTVRRDLPQGSERRP